MKFSVVIPLYNKQSCIRESLNSVLNQTYEDFEVIVVDDGSTDGSLEVVKGFSDERLRVIEKANGGVSSARNAGIAAARHEWIAFLDSDDIWSCFHLQALVDLHDRFPNAEVICTNYLPFSAGEDYIGKLYSIEQDMRCAVIKDYYRRLLSRKHCVWSSAVTIKKECFDTVGGFSENLIKGEDMHLWARLNERYTIAITEYITAFYRLDPPEGNATRRVSSVRKYEVYYFKPDFWKRSYKSMYQYRVIYGYLKHFAVYRQPKNLLLLLMRYNYKLLRLLVYRYEAKRMGIKF